MELDISTRICVCLCSSRRWNRSPCTGPVYRTRSSSRYNRLFTDKTPEPCEAQRRAQDGHWYQVTSAHQTDGLHYLLCTEWKWACVCVCLCVHFLNSRRHSETTRIVYLKNNNNKSTHYNHHHHHHRHHHQQASQITVSLQKDCTKQKSGRDAWRVITF